MREIKFRAFSKTNGIEYIENLYWFEERGVLDSKGEGHYEKYELMQYTGLKDCNGKEIYEGDIDERGIIIWSKECLGWFLKPFVQQFERDLIPLYDLSLPEIIGNIHENPELLEV